MFFRKSYQPLLSALIALCFLSSACSSGRKAFITRQQVSDFLEEMDKAAQRRDLESIVAHISTNAQFKLTMEGFGPTQTLSLNRDQYRAYARQGFELIEAYEYKRGDTVINIDPDGQTAYVADETFETATVRGKVIRTVSRGTAMLKLDNGKLMIASSQIAGRPLPTGPTSSRVSLR